ncbi:hypothetical protein CTAYLR_003059 [Chrysophaeum taylorii]|uniref:RBR-type E3 ubiquitin transferase n=1 Tax=Chrysophaeum taylorii TaxID=2483200 RepID=A0AAD7U7D9_9STRA|nr:hypothetical protein CTAYLR_003059 [Chrysophaeum taylorii]
MNYYKTHVGSDEVREEMVCQCCLGTSETPQIMFSIDEACGHQMCVTCTLDYVREGLGNRTQRFLPGGLKCFVASCGSILTFDRVRALVLVSRCLEAPLGTEEVAKFHRYSVEATLPVSRRCFCPTCNRVAEVADDDPALVRCPYCSESFCRKCLVPWHVGATCDEYQARRGNVGDNSAALVKATTRPCPICSTPTTHWHGHGCRTPAL